MTPQKPEEKPKPNAAVLAPTLKDIVENARTCIGHGIYKLGQGGIRALAPVPWNGKGECDCSGFALWCARLSRWQKGSKIGPNTDWIDTTAMYQDAIGEQKFFVRVLAPLPGDMIVYPDYYSKTRQRVVQGHVGVVTEVEGELIVKVVHCSTGNMVRFGYAIAETSGGVFANGRSIVVRRKDVRPDPLSER